MDLLQTQVYHFLKHRHALHQPLLLALSGGSDSTALYHLLLENKINFSVAHIDHGWREGSKEEAKLLRKLAAENNIPFYERALTSVKTEEGAREKRLEFYKELVLAHGFYATLLGHHAEDQAETVLKRVLEGASPHHLKGLTDESLFEGIRLWRPLLKVRKKEIILWLAARGIPYFEDETNRDKRFLRGRMREEILPTLAVQFGKEIVSSLCRLGASASELHDFFEEWLKPYRELYIFENEVFSVDFSKKTPRNIYEWKLVVRDFLERYTTPSMPTLEMIVFHLQEKSHHKEMVCGKTKLTINNQTLKISAPSPFSGNA